MIWLVNGKCGKFISKYEIKYYESKGIEVQSIYNHKLDKMEYFAVLGNDINKYLRKEVFKK